MWIYFNNRILNLNCARAWQKSNTNEITGYRQTLKTLRWVNDTHHQWWNTRNSTFRNERYRLRKILASICKKRSGHGHVLKSQGAAELRMQLIISIYEVLNAKRRHYARVPSLTGRDVLWRWIRLWDEFDCGWPKNYRSRISSQRQRDYFSYYEAGLRPVSKFLGTVQYMWLVLFVVIKLQRGGG